MAAPDLRGRSHHADQAFRWIAIAAACVVLLVLGMIAVTMTVRTGPVLDRMGLDYFTTTRWSEPNEAYGVLGLVWGTLYTATIAIVLAVPVSLGVALFITQIAPPWLKRPLVYTTDLLAVVPSVVFGLWGILVLGPPLEGIFDSITSAVDGIPVLERIFGKSGGTGRSFMTAGVILAIMITPIITSISREVIETTPASEKEAALALGATRWEMIRAAVLPHSKGGLVGAVMLGLGRALGETIAAALVIGGSTPLITANAFAGGVSMPSAIANEFGEADALHKSALIGLAVTLFLITIAINLLANRFVKRSMRRSRGRTT